MPYLNINEVESALTVATSAPYTGFTQLIPLPNLTWEGRQCNAIKIANGSDPGRPGVYFLGGIHSREWGSADILINFIEQLEQAYQNGTGITLGGKTFSASDIKTIVDNLDIYVFPQANPDGRNYSMNTEALWRKNRRTAAPNSNSGSCVGVDLNRNYDFLWDFQTLFAPTSTVSCSANPCDYQVYHGPNAFSEPETLNVKWVYDNFPNIGYFIDLHSFGPDILYSWGDDDNQETDPSMNFLNPAYNSVRGILDSSGDPGAAAYREYIPSGELAPRVDLANTFAAAIQAVRGTSYLVEQSVGLYPTAGASDDYSYSRHIADGSKHNVMAYTLEWGTEFQPPYSEMQNIIQEITSGLLAFCLWVRKSIESCVLTTDRSTFGKDEIDAMLHVSSPAKVDAAFYVVIDGFRHEELGITAATLVGVPDVKPNIAFNPLLSSKVSAHATACSTEGNVLVAGPQRFTWTFTMQFDDTSDFTQEVLPVTMTASLPTTVGVTMSAQAVITLTKQPNPYEIDGPVSWLSVDLQVCNVLENGFLASTPTITLNAGPNDFIKRMLTRYNDPTLPRAPNHPFDLDLVAHEDTSSVEIAGSVGMTPVYNFAIARVRYRALATPAPNVRVFFRIFQASTTSTEFEPPTTYLTGGMGGTKIPLLGVVGGEVVTIPCFAAARVDPTNPNGLNAQTDPLNVGPLSNPIPPDGTGAEVQVYFGCWLDINQNVNVLPGSPASAAGPFTPVQSIQQAIKNKHQCLVAEINLDPPEPQIATGVTPAVSDKLAQRNLNVVGVASPHLVPCTFDIKPTLPGLPSNLMPDELMIDWRSLPAGTKASIYLPGVSAKIILSTADNLYTHHELTSLDDHTLACKAEGISYIPIPPGTGSNHAGLMTLDVPPTTRKGQLFKVVARQITNTFSIAPEPQTPRGVAAVSAAAAPGVIQWRKVIGSFQISIPVKTKQALLEPEERLLSVLRWIAKTIPHDSRWHPVFRRYLEQTAIRVNALGGDSGQIGPSSSGDWKAASRCRVWGLVTAVLLGGLLASLGSLTGAALAVPALFAVFFVVAATIWFKKCRPKPSRWLQEFMTGAGLGAALLAILALIGITAPQLLPLLFALIIVMAAILFIRNV
ncbi:MAG TPA: M14 family metallopeptidase [Terriglobales bacterium]|jgi:murein tripeptide amidase MpaA|nr:M14 family metallopeptidase [Terriglobales bacterium]